MKLPIVSSLETLSLRKWRVRHMLGAGRHPTASFAPRFVKTVTLPLLYGLIPSGSGHFCLRMAARVSVDIAPPMGVIHGESAFRRSEEHTSELQSRENLVCRLLLEKKK